LGLITAAGVTFGNLSANGDIGSASTQVPAGDHTHSLLLPATATQGDILYWNGTAWTKLPAGAAGTVVTSTGAGANLAFQTPAGGGDTLSSATNTDTAVAIYDGTDSKAIEGSTILNSSLVLETLYIPAGYMTPSETAGASTDTVEYGTNDLTHDVMVFPGDTADSSAEFNVRLPENWNAGTVKFKLDWMTGHADANVDEAVGFTIAGRAFNDDDAMDQALGTAEDLIDYVTADDDLQTSPACDELTVAGSPAGGSLLHFKLTRNYDYSESGHAAMDVDCWVSGITMQFTKTGGLTAW
jgi:hypothetical protein